MLKMLWINLKSDDNLISFIELIRSAGYNNNAKKIE
jgi:hypothetical protein